MNHDKIIKRLLPLLLALGSAFVSYALAGTFEVKTWSNLAMICLIDFMFLWMMMNAKIDREKKIFMCCVISIMIALFTIPYSIMSYIYVHSDIAAIYLADNFVRSFLRIDH